MVEKISVCHIVDNEKFINGAFQLFNQYDWVTNDFFCVEDKPTIDFNSKQIGINTILLKDVSSFVQQKVVNYDIVIFHNFIPNYKFSILRTLRKHQVALWIGWGFDLYKYIDNKSFLTARNQQFLEGLYNGSVFKRVINKLGFYKIKYFISWYLKFHPNLSYLAERVQYYAPPIKYEFNLLKNYFPKSPIKYVDWNYSYHLPSDISDWPRSSQINILAGNSASAQNNHCDIIDLLSTYKENFKVHLPLSYGGDAKYKAAIVKYAKDLLKDRVSIIDDFLLFEEYSKVLACCQIGFFNSIRQQGMGNIIYLLWNGSKVFMNANCPFFHFLLENDVYVFSIENFSKNDLNTPLSDVQKIKNRLKMIELYGMDALQKKTKNTIDELIKAVTLVKQSSI